MTARADRPIRTAAVVFFDLETTGLRPDRGARITEMAVVDQEGICFDWAADAEPPSDAAVARQLAALIDALRGSIVVGHNLSFDFRLLTYEAERLGHEGLGTVYGDLRVIEATWHIPEDNRTLVERVTHPDPLQAIVQEGDEAWHRHEQWVLGSRQADRQTAGYVTIDRTAPFAAKPFPDDLETAKTRLGQEDYRVDLPTPAEGPFGEVIEELSVSEWQLDEPPETEETTDVSEGEGSFTFRFNDHAFQYDRLGLSSISS